MRRSMTRYFSSAQSRSSSEEGCPATCACVMMQGIFSRMVLDFGKPA